jgi:hypothetical protein
VTTIRATTLPGFEPLDLELSITGGSGNTDRAEIHVAVLAGGSILDQGWFDADEVRSAILRATNPIFTRPSEGDAE